MDSSGSWLTTARAFGVAFGGLLAATVAVGVAVGSGVLTTLLIVLTMLAPAGAVVAWLGACAAGGTPS